MSLKWKEDFENVYLKIISKTSELVKQLYSKNSFYVNECAVDSL